MQVSGRLKQWFNPSRGDLKRLEFHEAGTSLSAFCPDDEVFGLTREMLLQRVYDVFGRPPRGTVVDAGAHVGLFSLLAAVHAERVVALEPSPLNRAVLTLNCAMNGLHNIDVRGDALWTSDGTMPFDVSWHSTGGRIRKEGSLRASTRSLDSLVEELGRIDLLKIDIEGAEFEVLEQATRLDRIDRIVGELHFRSGQDQQPVQALLRDAGFDVRLVPAKSLYAPRQIRAVLRNWGAVQGQLKLKAALVAYLAAPLDKPARPQWSRDMPLIVAARPGRG